MLLCIGQEKKWTNEIEVRKQLCNWPVALKNLSASLKSRVDIAKRWAPDNFPHRSQWFYQQLSLQPRLCFKSQRARDSPSRGAPPPCPACGFRFVARNSNEPRGKFFFSFPAADLRHSIPFQPSFSSRMKAKLSLTAVTMEVVQVKKEKWVEQK